MGAPRNFVTGFNHNVRHKGETFHVQTEDSGAEHGHIITHLFQGGNIIASKRTSYAEMLGAPNLLTLVRTLMEEQHKEMLRNLVSGVYDSALPSAEAAPPRESPPLRQPARQAPPPVPPPTPTPLPGQHVAAWPWSGKGRPKTPPPFRAPKLSHELASWPAGAPKPTPPPLPGGAPRQQPTPRPTPKADAPTLRSEDLVSDRSLDEVILRYLSGERDDD